MNMDEGLSLVILNVLLQVPTKKIKILQAMLSVKYEHGRRTFFGHMITFPML
jgi:hypothetical protein